MKYYFLQNELGEIKGYTNKKPKCNILKAILLDVTKAEIEQIENTKPQLLIEDNKLKIKEK